MRYTAAAVQYEPRFGEKAHNLARLLDLVEEAARAGARLVVLPEMAATGYCFRSRAEIAPHVEPVPGGPTVAAFMVQAARLGIYVVVGLPEVDPATEIYYNTAALIGPEGLVGKYRKLHSFIDETRWAKDGDLGMPVFDTSIGRIAIQICMDADYIEPARLAALAGADLIAFPTNWLGDQTVWYARAAENGTYMLCANRWGQERGTQFCGNSAVIDPEGHLLSLLSTGDGLCLAEIDLAKGRAARLAALAGRRPELYHDLVIHTHLWHPQDSFDALPKGRQVVVAAGQAVTPAAMADQARWADCQVRDKGMKKLDLMLFPFCPSAVAATRESLLPVARDLDCYIAWGAMEGGAETVWLAGPEGLVGQYRAIHPLRAEEAGDQFALFDLPWGRVGLATGADLRVPETARILAKRGADLILAPLVRQSELDRTLWNARWQENNTAVVVAPHQGDCTIYGCRPKAQAGLDGLLFGMVETGSDRVRQKELLRKLQPFWYTPLVGREP